MTKTGSLETLLESLAAAWIAACTAYALWLSAGQLGIDNPLALILAGSALAALATHRTLWLMRRKSCDLAEFEPLSVQPVEPVIYERLGELLLTPDMALLKTELLLTRGQMLGKESAPETGSDELLLDDVLAELGPDSRVVRLFDPARVPTAGELQSRIDRHLSKGRRAGSEEPLPDESQALFDALADLRRSLA